MRKSMFVFNLVVALVVLPTAACSSSKGDVKDDDGAAAESTAGPATAEACLAAYIEASKTQDAQKLWSLMSSEAKQEGAAMVEKFKSLSDEELTKMKLTRAQVDAVKTAVDVLELMMAVHGDADNPFKSAEATDLRIESKGEAMAVGHFKLGESFCEVELVQENGAWFHNGSMMCNEGG